MRKAENELIVEEELHKDDKKFHAVFKKDIIIKGSLWFALISIITIAGIFFYNNTGNAIKALKSIRPQYIFLCSVMMFVDLFLGGWRNHFFIRKLKPELSQWTSFKANVANMFMGAVTPSHSGAGPAQIYVYMRHGVSFINSFMVTLINLGATLIFMPAAGLVAILLLRHENVGGVVTSLLRYGFTVFAVLLVAFLLTFLKPVWVGRLIKRFAKFLARIFTKRKRRLLRWGERTFNNIAIYQENCSNLLKKHPMLFPLALLTTAILYLNKYVLQYVILLGLGVQADLMQVITIQILIQFMIYFAPSPGGSGFAELSISVLFEKVVPATVLPVFTLLQRSFLLFFPALIGAYFLISLLKKQTQKVLLVSKKQEA